MAPPVLIVGCGDLGSETARQLTMAGHAVVGVRRSSALSLAGGNLVQADVSDPRTLASLAHLKPEVMLYCVAADMQSDDSYKVSYVDGLRNVLSTLGSCPSLRHVFFVSSTRVYGQETDVWLDEGVCTEPRDFRGQRLLEAEALLSDAQVPSTVLRLSGLYGSGRYRLLELARKPEVWPLDNIWINRIHRDDAASFISHCVEMVFQNVVPEPLYLVTDSQPATQYEVLTWLAESQGVKCDHVVIPPVNGGKRYSNKRMLASGYRLIYPDYMAGYGALLRALS